MKYIYYTFNYFIILTLLFYNLTIIVLAINNLTILGNIIVDTIYNNIVIAKIPNVNKFKK